MAEELAPDAHSLELPLRDIHHYPVLPQRDSFGLSASSQDVAPFVVKASLHSPSASASSWCLGVSPPPPVAAAWPLEPWPSRPPPCHSLLLYPTEGGTCHAMRRVPQMFVLSVAVLSVGVAGRMLVGGGGVEFLA